MALVHGVCNCFKIQLFIENENFDLRINHLNWNDEIYRHRFTVNENLQIKNAYCLSIIQELELALLTVEQANASIKTDNIVIYFNYYYYRILYAKMLNFYIHNKPNLLRLLEFYGLEIGNWIGDCNLARVKEIIIFSCWCCFKLPLLSTFVLIVSRCNVIPFSILW